ncbi:hypothetical protein, partial [Kluyvera sp. Awk 3]|uniref:hypothetical protein n=1 Tax=Kluyvera sp. Awk 3 TaxID=2963956 RepID=UPI0023039562
SHDVIDGATGPNDRTNPAEARRIVEPGPTLLNSQETQVQWLNSSLAGEITGQPTSAGTPDTSADRTSDGRTTQNR